jgi:hypothetical protein
MLSYFANSCNVKYAGIRISSGILPGTATSFGDGMHSYVIEFLLMYIYLLDDS